MQFVNPLNSSPLAFPILECIISWGSLFLLDHRYCRSLAALHLGMRGKRRPAGQRHWSVWTLVRSGDHDPAGMALYSSDPDMYYLNYAFLGKMLFLDPGYYF